MRVGLAVAVLVSIAAGTAAARPPPPCHDNDEEEDYRCPPPPSSPPRQHRPAIEWSTWFRVAFGMKDERAASAPRMAQPPPATGQDTAWEVGLGAEASIGVSPSGDLRIGPWVEVRGVRDVVGGGELVLTAIPKSIDMFFYKGQGILALRVGRGAETATAQVAYGYLAPWKLFDQPRGAARYMIGVRVVGSVTRAIDDPSDWSATLGLEVEPVGALRYLLGIKALY